MRSALRSFPRHLDPSEIPEACRESGCPMAKRAETPVQSQGGATGAVSSPASGQGPLCDWLGSQSSVLNLWLDRLIEQGDPDDLVSMVHRQQAWLELMRARVGSG